MIGQQSGTTLRGRGFQRILLIKPSSLGDVIHALPVLDALRQGLPEARIDWLISTSLAPLLAGHPHINELVPFDRRRYGKMWRSPRALAGFVEFLRRLREARYDLVIDLQGLFRTGFFAWVTGAPVRVGLDPAREGASWFYTHQALSPGSDAHAVDRYCAVLDLLDLTREPSHCGLYLTEEDRSDAAAMLGQSGEDERRLVVVVPGARWETKIWPGQRFVEVIDELQQSGAARCMLLGGPDEQQLCRTIADSCTSSPLDLSGRTSLRQMSALLELADVVLCHDSGPMHVAVALGRPVVCIMGPTNPLRTGPYRRPESVVRLDLDCAPCYLKRLSQCPHGHRCMEELDAARVLTAVRRALRDRKPASLPADTPVVNR